MKNEFPISENTALYKKVLRIREIVSKAGTTGRQHGRRKKPDYFQNRNTRLRNQVTAFSQLPVDVEPVRPEFPFMSDTAVSRISSTCAVPVTAEFGPEKNTYVRECVRQNTLLEEQNVLLRNQNTLLKDIREKPVIQDSDVFSSYQRSQRSYFAATGRTGISGVD